MSFMRMEDWCLDCQRTVTEIKRHDGQPTGAVYVIESHGCKITNDYFTSPKLGQLTKSDAEFEQVVGFVSSFHLCKGFRVENAGTGYNLEDRVAVFTSFTDLGIRELRRFSSKCILICLQGSCCCECSQLRRVEMQREKRSKSRQGTTIQPKHNNRYMTREQLSSKLKEEKRERKMGKAREQRLNEKLADASNLIELGEEDHVDFSAIMSGLEGSGKILGN